jgi:hypothetical protein
MNSTELLKTSVCTGLQQLVTFVMNSTELRSVPVYNSWWHSSWTALNFSMHHILLLQTVFILDVVCYLGQPITWGPHGVLVLYDDVVNCYEYKASVIDERVWRTNVATVTNKNLSIRRNTCSNASLSTTNPKEKTWDRIWWPTNRLRREPQTVIACYCVQFYDACRSPFFCWPDIQFSWYRVYLNFASAAPLSWLPLPPNIHCNIPGGSWSHRLLCSLWDMHQGRRNRRASTVQYSTRYYNHMEAHLMNKTNVWFF